MDAVEAPFAARAADPLRCGMVMVMVMGMVMGMGSREAVGTPCN